MRTSNKENIKIISYFLFKILLSVFTIKVNGKIICAAIVNIRKNVCTDIIIAGS